MDCTSGPHATSVQEHLRYRSYGHHPVPPDPMQNGEIQSVSLPVLNAGSGAEYQHKKFSLRRIASPTSRPSLPKANDTIELKRIIEEKQELQRQLDEVTAEVKNRIIQYQASIQSYEELLDKAGIAKLQKELASAKLQLKKDQKMLREGEDSSLVSKQKIATLKEELEELSATQREQCGKIEELEQEVARLNSVVERCELTNRSCTEQIHSLQEKLENSLKRKSEIKSKSRKRSRDSASEIGALKLQLEVERQNSLLYQKLNRTLMKEADSSQTKIVALSQENARISGEFKKFKSETVETQKKRAKSQEKEGKKLKKAKNSVNMFSKENEHLKREIKNMERIHQRKIRDIRTQSLLIRDQMLKQQGDLVQQALRKANDKLLAKEQIIAQQQKELRLKDQVIAEQHMVLLWDKPQRLLPTVQQMVSGLNI